MKRLLSLAIAAVLSAPPVLVGQSLADVARAEEARRKNVKKAARVYTNDDLKPDFTVPHTSMPAPATDSVHPPGPAEGKAGSSPEASPAPETQTKPAPSPAQDEAFWRKRMAAARADLQRTEMFAEALQSGINALTTDFVSRDDPAQRGTIEQDRQKALSELERVGKDREKQIKAIADIEEEARKAGVPPGWLR